MNNYQDTENKIIGKLLKTPLESKSLHQLSKETKLSYVTVHKIIPNLIKKKIIKLEKKGKSNLISIDFDNCPIYNLSSAMLYEREFFLKKDVQLTIFLRELEESLSNNFYSLILFGSYAKGNYTKKSDIDLLFIIPSRDFIDKYKEKIDKVVRLHTSNKKHIHIVSVEDFMDMLNNKNTLGRSAFQNGIILFGTEQYYAMVKKYVRRQGY